MLKSENTTALRLNLNREALFCPDWIKQGGFKHRWTITDQCEAVYPSGCNGYHIRQVRRHICRPICSPNNDSTIVS